MSDVEFMKDPDKWPYWPVLPLKRYVNNNLECGLIFASGEPKIFLTNVFAGKNLEEVDTISYESYEALTGAGWMID